MRTLATFFCGLALASLIVPSSTAGQESFRQAMIDAGKQALTNGTIDRRDMLRLRVSMIMPRTRDHIQAMVLQELWLDGTIGDHFTSEGKYDVSQVAWGDGAILQKLIDNLPQIIEFIRSLIDIFGGLTAITNGDGPPINPPLTEDAQAAQALLHNVAARLASNIRTIRANAESEEFTINGLNAAIGRAIDEAFGKSKVEFQEYSQPRIINAGDPLPVLDQYIVGFGG